MRYREAPKPIFEHLAGRAVYATAAERKREDKVFRDFLPAGGAYGCLEETIVFLAAEICVQIWVWAKGGTFKREHRVTLPRNIYNSFFLYIITNSARIVVSYHLFAIFAKKEYKLE